MVNGCRAKSIQRTGSVLPALTDYTATIPVQTGKVLASDFFFFNFYFFGTVLMTQIKDDGIHHFQC